MPRSLPLFPLNTVLVPGAALGLRVFEPRYLDLVRDCSRGDAGFEQCGRQHGGMGLGRMAVRGLERGEKPAHAMAHQAGFQTAVAHAGGHAQHVAPGVEPRQQRADPGIERLFLDTLKAPEPTLEERLKAMLGQPDA